MLGAAAAVDDADCDALFHRQEAYRAVTPPSWNDP